MCLQFHRTGWAKCGDVRQRCEEWRTMDVPQDVALYTAESQIVEKELK